MQILKAGMVKYQKCLAFGHCVSEPIPQTCVSDGPLDWLPGAKGHNPNRVMEAVEQAIL